VKAAAVAVDETPRRVRDELAQRRHPVLQRHSDTVDGARSGAAAKRPLSGIFARSENPR
jgi:hypothetical protein